MRLIALSNRGPLRKRGGNWVRSSGGLVTALDPVLRRHGGVWVSSAESERQESTPELGYTVAPVHLSRRVKSRYYGGFSNGVLWPLLHGFPPTIRLAEAPWDDYREANRAFAKVALDHTEEGDVVWAHDYHLFEVPALLRAERPKLRIGWFCHIPWPGADHFAILPWREAMLRSLLSADLIAFHSAGYVRNFLDCAERFADCSVDRKTGIARVGRHIAKVRVAPIGIPTAEVGKLVQDPQVRAKEVGIRTSVRGRRIILGVDRLDYSKGIPERFLAYARLLERRPALREEIVLVQIVVPSREDVRAYAHLRDELDRLVGRINGRFARTGRAVLHYLYRSVPPADLYAHYRAAEVALVTPLRDGMNLVAQEYAASHPDGSGALVLSEFAGAAERLKDAYLVNPYDVDAVADQVERALEDPAPERESRMRSIYAEVQDLDVHRWAERFLNELSGEGEQAAPALQPR